MKSIRAVECTEYGIDPSSLGEGCFARSTPLTSEGCAPSTRVEHITLATRATSTPLPTASATTSTTQSSLAAFNTAGSRPATAAAASRGDTAGGARRAEDRRTGPPYDDRRRRRPRSDRDDPRRGGQRRPDRQDAVRPVDHYTGNALPTLGPTAVNPAGLTTAATAQPGSTLRPRERSREAGGPSGGFRCHH